MNEHPCEHTVIPCGLDDFVQCIECKTTWRVRALRRVKGEKITGYPKRCKRYFCACNPNLAIVFDWGDGKLVLSDPERARLV